MAEARNSHETAVATFSAPRNITNPFSPLKDLIRRQSKALLYVKTPPGDESEKRKAGLFNVTDDVSKVVSPIGGAPAVPVVVARDRDWMDYDWGGVIDFKVENTWDYFAEDDTDHVGHGGKATWAFCDTAEDDCPGGSGPFADATRDAGLDGAEARIIMLP